MNKKRMRLRWSGSFIELCMGRITRDQKDGIEADYPYMGKDFQTLWYDNTTLLKTHFNADNWWSVDDLDHVMGLYFADRAALEAGLAALTVEIDGTAATIDPEALQLSVYAPETIAPLGKHELVVCHGVRRETVMHLETDFLPPFDPSLITLSFLDYPNYGFILIDLDYDGYDDVSLTFGEADYLKPQFTGKDPINETAG